MGFKILSLSLIFLSANLMAMELSKAKIFSQPDTPQKKTKASRFIDAERTFKKPCLDPNKNHMRFMPEGVRQDYHKVFDDKDIIQVYVNAPFDTSSDVIMPKKMWLNSVKFKDREIKVHNQVALRACGWSCVDMVLLNNGIQDYSLAFRNQLCDAIAREKVLNLHKITTELDIAIGDLNIDIAKEMNITCKCFIENKDVIAHMQEKLKTYSCALVSITNKHIDGHCIIVYAVDEDGVVLCDPFHGWLIKVKKEAFMNEINGYDPDFGNDSQTILWVANLK